MTAVYSSPSSVHPSYGSPEDSGSERAIPPVTICNRRKRSKPQRRVSVDQDEAEDVDFEYEAGNDQLVNTPALHNQLFNTPAFHDQLVNTPALHNQLVNTPAFHDQLVNTPALHNQLFNTPVKIERISSDEEDKIAINNNAALPNSMSLADTIIQVIEKSVRKGVTKLKQEPKEAPSLSNKQCADFESPHQYRSFRRGSTVHLLSISPLAHPSSYYNPSQVSIISVEPLDRISCTSLSMPIVLESERLLFKPDNQPLDLTVKRQLPEEMSAPLDLTLKLKETDQLQPVNTHNGSTSLLSMTDIQDLVTDSQSAIERYAVQSRKDPTKPQMSALNGNVGIMSPAMAALEHQLTLISHEAQPVISSLYRSPYTRMDTAICHTTPPHTNQCLNCSKLFKTSIKLTDSGQSLCDVCLATDTSLSRDAKPFTCNHCGKSFNRASNLHTHMRTHTNYKPFKCQYCEKGFHQKIDMKIHSYTHTGEKPHKCKVCGRGFKQLTHLTYHLRTHSTHKMYKCPYCEKGFNQKGNLQAHIYGHTGERPFKCEYCGKGFTLASTLNTHKRTHADRKPFICPFCSKDFFQKNALKSHLIASHPFAGGTSLL